MTPDAVERRRFVRSTASDRGILLAVVRPGHAVLIIDVSTGGVSLEISHRLSPGSIVDLRLSTAEDQATVRGRVLRCAVTAVQPTTLTYRAAIGFDRPPSFFREREVGAYPVPMSESPTPLRERVVETRDAL
jgi:hypothetical protein